MTSGNVNNFVSDLVLMAKAMEELPQVKSDLDHVMKENASLSDSITQRELSIARLKQEIEQLHAKVRSTEAERDDAEMRFLELDDKAHNAIAMAKAAQVSLSQLDGLLNPPKPEPVPEPQAESEVKHEPDWIKDQSHNEPEVKHKEPSYSYYDHSVAQATNEVISQGQSEPLPPEVPMYKGQPLPVTSFEEVPKSDANPTSDASSTDVSSQSAPSTVENTADAKPVDDVGYHNEPDVGTDWTAWNAWCERMRQRYGAGAWPQRPDNAAPSVA